MAMEYQNFASLGVNLNRQKYGPLDISNVFTSEADLKYYLTKGTHTEGVSEYWYKSASDKIVPYPYEGQVLATVIDGVVNVYALALDAEGNFVTQEIAGKIEVDNKTIKLNEEGKLELVGLPTNAAGKTFVPSLVNGELIWAEPDTSTAEGQQQAIDGLTASVANLGEILNGKEAEGEEGSEDYIPAKKGLVELVAENAQVIIDEAAAREEADEALAEAIEEALQAAKDYADEKAYDETELKNKVEAIEADYLTSEHKEQIETAYTNAIADAKTAAIEHTDEAIDGLTLAIEQEEGLEYIIIKDKDKNEVSRVNASKFVQDSFLDDVAYNAETGKVTFTWTMGDGSTKTDEIDIAHLVDTYTAGNGLKVENNEFSVDTTVIATVEALNAVSEVAEAAQTATEVEEKINAKLQEANLGQYAIAADVETALNSKVDSATYEEDKATFALTSEVETTLESYYTTEEVDAKGYAVATEVAETYATKVEVETLETNINEELAKKIETASIAHSSETTAEGVTVDGTKLNIVVDAYTKQEVRDYVADVIEDMTGGESAADVLLALNNHIDTYTEKVGQLDTKDAAQDTAIANAQAAITTLESTLNGVSQKATDNASAIATIQGDITNLKTADEGFTKTISEQSTKIGTIEGNITSIITNYEAADSELDGKITALTTTVNTKASQDSVDNVIALIGNVEDGKTVAELITESVYDDSAVLESIQANAEAIEALYVPADGETPASGTIVDLIAAEKTRAEEAEKANADAIKLLSDGIDPDKIDGVKDLIGYVEEHGETTEAIVNMLAGIGGEDQPATVIAAISKAIREIPAYDLPVATAEILGGVKASEEINVAEDGAMSIGQVSTDKLVQGTATLVLNGGSSSNEE